MAEIILDLFSGRPNPRWTLPDGAARELLDDVVRARDVLADADDASGGLGFRGLVVSLSDEDRDRGLPRRFRVGPRGNGRDVAARLVAALGRADRSGDDGLLRGLAPLEELDLAALIRDDPRHAEGDAAAPASILQALNPAPVLGTDASSWSTTSAGACGIEVAAFNPTFWNAAAVQPNNNCYNYATNRRTDTFAQPGRAAGAQATRMRCGNVAAGAVADGAVQAPTCAPSSSAPRWYMALVIWPQVDYHWYRRQQEGFWGHKPGQTAARNTDNSGVVITNPETANRGGYRDFCGYFFAQASQGIR